MPELATLPVRCAIYTRKSVEVRLDRDFNSLESQREVCSAYITSQRHKGWVTVDKVYADAGQSGGNIDRPALQDLVRDIESGLITVIVIYKIDRLTRSLADFVRLMDLFERYQVSFVSVTQSFDTSDSMGRLVLNILLTFAQFEREIIADRIRDKMSAMRRRGKWTGGPPPYGYDVIERRLVINHEEATKVRSIFDRFLELGSYQKVCQELKTEGMRTKVWTNRKGEAVGGSLVSNGMIYSMLGNCLYAGQVSYDGETYPGEHEAILSSETWAETQKLRAQRAMFRPNTGPSPNILLGLIYDSHGRKMVISDERKTGRRYRYYMSEQSRWAALQGLKRFRSRADDLEQLVLSALSRCLEDREKVRQALLLLGRPGRSLDHIATRLRPASHNLAGASLERRREIVVALISRGELSREDLKLVLRCSEIENFLKWDGKGIFRANKATWTSSEPTLLIDIPVNAVRFERSLVIPLEPADPAQQSKPDANLIEAIRDARRGQAMLDNERDKSVADIARRFNRRPGFFARILRLNYLAPDIIAAILDGTQPTKLSRQRLVYCDLPMDWALQRKMFGFAGRPDHQRSEPRY